jgi:hypothetical protein
MKKTLLKNLPLLMLLLITAISCSKEKKIIPDKGTFSISSVNITIIENEEITITAGDTWTAAFVTGKTTNNWVAMDKTSGDAGVFKIKFRSKIDNTSNEERNVLVKFISGSSTLYATVTQRPLKSNIVSKGRVEVPEEGGNFNIRVKEYDKCKITIPEKFTWITQSTGKPSSTNGASDVNFSVGKGVNRTGHIIIQNGTITDTVRIFQYPANKLILSTDTLNLYKATTNLEVYFRENAEYTYSIVDDEKWLNEASIQDERVDCKVLSMSENSTDKFKKALFIVKEIASGKSDTLQLYHAFFNTLPFLSETTPGIYNFDHAEGKFTYSKFKDQYSSKINSKTKSFRIQSIKNKSYLTLNSIPVDIDMADYFETRVLQNCIATISRNIVFKANVVKVQNGSLWLYDSESGIGIIIKK